MEKIKYLIKEDKKEKCKGLVFRCVGSSFLSSHNSIETRKSLRLLKTKSCSNCNDCSWVLEFIKDDISCMDSCDYLNGLTEGQIYKLNIVTSHDAQTGDYDAEVEFRKVQP